MFEDILGQEIPKKFIENSIKKNRINHSYLFEGPYGVGKENFVLEFCKVLLNTSNLENCPDFNQIYPDENSFKISQIRNLQNDIIIKPYSDKKVYVLYDCEKMTTQAQNSFLKTLEEPPSYAIIIMLTNNSLNILNTIKSRCEIIKFSYIATKLIEDYLVGKENIDEGDARVIASFADGNLEKAKHLINDDDFKKERELVKDNVSNILTTNIIDALNVIKYLDSKKDSINSILDMIISYFRDFMIINEDLQDSILINADQIDFIHNVGNNLTCFQITSIIDIIEETKKKIILNCNYSLAIEVMVFNIHEVIK